MFYKIDYLAFTIPIRAPIEEIDHEKLEFVLAAFLSIGQLQAAFSRRWNVWSIEKGRAPYHTRLRHPIAQIALSVGKVNPHIYVEAAGQACDFLDGIGELDTIIREWGRRASRIDFAVDIQTDTTPSDFSAFRNSKAFKSYGHYQSPTGSTYYVGGRTSERMARVYRYESPHPRSGLLRVEAEYKGDAAKAACEYYNANGLQKACVDAHSPFQWAHPDWTPDDTAGDKITYRSYSRENASTVHWLYGVVIASLSKAASQGVIDIEDWLQSLHKAI